MDGHPAKRSRLTQDEANNQDPTPPNPDLTLPLEILAHIISLADNNTLSKWMRVSSEYNKIAVPYLYEYITIGPGDRSPFAATTENMIRRPIQRKSAEKMNNLAMVKGIAISAPYKDDGDWNLPNRGLPLDWLRISERICCEEYINDVCHPYTSGDALEQLRPGKFIVKTSLSQPILAYAWTAKKVVLVHLPVTDPNFCAAFPSIELGGKPEEIVYIFWSKGPSHPSLTCGESGLDELCGDLWRDRLRPNQAPKAVFVNAGGIDPFQFDLINPTYQEKETTFRAVFNDTFGLPGPSAGDWAPRDIRVDMPECSWLTMREYLTKYDWTGEFTAEEVEPWLRDEKQEGSE